MTVAVTPDPIQFAMFRDGPGAQWKNMDKGGDGSFTATVTGPYEVSVVCQINANTTWLTWEHGDEPDSADATTTNLTPPCADVATFALSGTVAVGDMVSVGYGPALHADQVTGGFTFNVPSGTYDLTVVHADGKVAFATAPVTVAGAAKALGAVALGAPLTLTPEPFDGQIVTDNQGTDDAPRFEFGAVQVLLSTPNSPQPTVIAAAEGGLNADKSKSISKIPTGVLAAADVPKGYTQQVTYSGTITDPLLATQTLERSTNRDFTVGDSDTILMPAGYGSVVWSEDPAGLSFIGDSDPPDVSTITITGMTTEAKPAINIIEATQNYLNDTSIVRLVLETDLTGYSPTWKVDTNQKYTRNTQGVLRVDDNKTDPPTHDNREWSSTQDQGTP